MEISQLILAQLWLYAFFLGAGLGAVYDVFTIFRVFLGVPFSGRTEALIAQKKCPLLKKIKFAPPRPVSALLIFFTDFFFCLGAFGALILLFYQMNNGELRLPPIFCTILGFSAYRASFSRFFRMLLEIALLVALNLLFRVFRFMIIPLCLLARHFLSFYQGAVRRRERKQRIRFTESEKRRLSKNGCGLF